MSPTVASRSSVSSTSLVTRGSVPIPQQDWDSLAGRCRGNKSKYSPVRRLPSLTVVSVPNTVPSCFLGSKPNSMLRCDVWGHRDAHRHGNTKGNLMMWSECSRFTQGSICCSAGAGKQMATGVPRTGDALTHQQAAKRYSACPCTLC